MTEPDRSRYIAIAIDEAKDTFKLWRDLHPIVPAPRPRKERDEVVRRLATARSGHHVRRML